jgi:hypothetical protein
MPFLSTRVRRELALPPNVIHIPLTCYRYAEMEKTVKNKVSHRGKALEKLQAWFAKEMSA